MLASGLELGLLPLALECPSLTDLRPGCKRHTE